MSNSKIPKSMSSPTKKIYVSLISLLVFASVCYSQVDSRITLAFGKEYVERVQNSNPEIIQYYSLFLDNGFYISSVKTEDVDMINRKLPLLTPKEEFKSFVENDFTNSSFNPFFYAYELNYKHSKVYRLDENGTIIEFFPSKKTIDAFNQKKNSSKTK